MTPDADDEMPRITLRVPERLETEIKLAVERGGFANRSEYIRYVLRRDLRTRNAGETITSDPAADTGGVV